ncbi:cytochrome P450 [Halobellus sp. EA9]|uniref:cytochrome P450 n=1 Tax=Halobellus sp. EA9 TaxID=3421647 RepID=UPI003EBF2CCB
MELNAGETWKESVPEACPAGLKSVSALHDPHEWYARKRRAGPVQYDPDRDVFDVFSYRHVKAALQDSDRLVRKELTRGHTDTGAFDYIDNAMVWSDGTKHKESKSQLFSYFRPDLLRGLTESIEEIARRQVDEVLADGSDFDFVSEFAVPVPLRVVMELVGIPKGDHDRMLTWLETFREVMNTEYSAVGSTDGDRMAEAVTYFEELVETRRADPQSDLISRLVTETELTGAEIGANCFDFILAGQGTMSEFLANALYLFETEDMLERIDDYDLDVVLEEVLRYRTPLQSRARETTERVAMGETTIPPGETVILWLGAANRDPQQFEASDTFRPRRDPDHLAFGSGPHTCIGAPLARLEAPLVLETFLDAFEHVSVETDAMRPKPKPSKLGFDRLPVSTTPA